MYKFLLISRYLRKRTLILLSAGGMTVAVMVFIVIFSVLEGFGKGIVSTLRGTMSDVVIEDTSGSGIADYDEIMRDLESEIDDVEVCSPFIERIAMFQSASFNRSVEEDGYTVDRARERTRARYGRIRGIDPEREARVGNLTRYLAKGGFYESHRGIRTGDILRPGARHVIVGKDFALPAGFATNENDANVFLVRRFDARGAYITSVPWSRVEGNTFAEKARNARALFGPELRIRSHVFLISSLITDSPQPINFGDYTVAGQFETGHPEYDGGVVLMHYKDAQELLGMGGSGADALTGGGGRKPTVSGINIKLKPGAYERLKRIKPAIEGVLARYGTTFKVRGWTEVRRKMLDAVATEKALAFIILSCIVLAMGFGIFAIQSFSVVRHRRDIGIMKALGATNGGVMAVFLGVSVAVGVVGAALGVMLGIIIAANVNEILSVVEHLFGWELFPKDLFYLDRIPSEISPITYGVIAGVAIAICTLAGILPAAKAARQEPVVCLMAD